MPSVWRRRVGGHFVSVRPSRKAGGVPRRMRHVDCVLGCGGAEGCVMPGMCRRRESARLGWRLARARAPAFQESH